MHPDHTSTPALAAPPALTREEFAARLTDMRAAFDGCHVALLRAADYLTLAAGLAMNEPSRIVIRQNANNVRQAAARLLASVEG